MNEEIQQYIQHAIKDQNEKLVHYGVTYVMARDGYSGKLVGAAVMPRKNNELIYPCVQGSNCRIWFMESTTSGSWKRVFSITLHSRKAAHWP